jgi:hypothetical protein
LHTDYIWRLWAWILIRQAANHGRDIVKSLVCRCDQAGDFLTVLFGTSTPFVNMPVAHVITFLIPIIDLHGRPSAIRCDNVLNASPCSSRSNSDPDRRANAVDLLNSTTSHQPVGLPRSLSSWYRRNVMRKVSTASESAVCGSAAVVPAISQISSSFARLLTLRPTRSQAASTNSAQDRERTCAGVGNWSRKRTNQSFRVVAQYRCISGKNECCTFVRARETW